jgi:aminoglycoside phosphotransferase (APT) family kinase protein
MLSCSDSARNEPAGSDVVVPPAADECAGLPVDRLAEWVGDQLPGAGMPFSAERIGTDVGIANVLFALRRGGKSFVLRRPPQVKNAPSASDIRREWRVLTALEGTPVPHPRALLYCEDPDVIGWPFLIMSFVEGFTPVGTLAPPYNIPAARRALGFAMVDAIADLSAVDWQACGLRDFGKPAGFLDRQVTRWMGQLATYQTRDILGLERLAAWLEANKPSAQIPGLLHGDYSPFNVMASWSRPDRLAAVVDWDSSTIGDPVLDIGHLLARWTEPGEQPALVRVDIADRDGLPRRHELASRYAQRSGRDLSAISYYEALALFKLGLILEGGVSRARNAGDVRTGADIAATVDRLISVAGQFASGERI